MKHTLTIVCKLQPTQKQIIKIDETLKGFADACNHANQQIDAKLTNKRTMQTLVYREIRALFGLSANLAVRFCARVAANRKTAKLKKKAVKGFAPTTADYDARIFDYREKDLTVSLILMGGRERIKFHAANYQLGKIKGKKPTSAQLCNHIGWRSDKRFKCGNCGWHGDADLNGAINISKLGGVFVSHPRGSNQSCSLNRDDSGLLQNPCAIRSSESTGASAGG